MMPADPGRRVVESGSVVVRRLYQAIDQQDTREIRKLFDLDSQLREICSKFGASPWAFAKFGYRASYFFHTPLQYACMKDFSGKVVSCLLRLGCWVNNVGSLQVTPLHMACKYNNETAVRVLLAYNPSLTLKDGRGRTPRDVARIKAIIDLLAEQERVNEQHELDYDWVMVEKHDQCPTKQHSRQPSAGSIAVNHPPGCTCDTCKGEDLRLPTSEPETPLATSPRPSFLDFSFLRNVGLGRMSSAEGFSEQARSVTTFGLIPFEELELDKKLGRGGFGTVWRARWNSITLAAKVLSKAPGQENKREIMNEIHMFYLLSACQHPNIITFIGACSVGETVCLCTEYASGGSLYDLIHTSKKQYDLRTVRRWGVDIADGMHYLFGRNILHRDLKSPNILLADREFEIDDFIESDEDIPLEHLVCKIADFGLSRQLDDVSEAQTGGTFRWMAPEVMCNGDVTYKSDVYSFGTVLWELVTRSLPFDGKNPAEVIYGVVQYGLRPHVPKSFPKSTGALVQSCWQKEPSIRPTFSEISEFLRDCDMVAVRDPNQAEGNRHVLLVEDNPAALSLSQSDWSKEIAAVSSRTITPEESEQLLAEAAPLSIASRDKKPDRTPSPSVAEP